MKSCPHELQHRSKTTWQKRWNEIFGLGKNWKGLTFQGFLHVLPIPLDVQTSGKKEPPTNHREEYGHVEGVSKTMETVVIGGSVPPDQIRNLWWVAKF